MRKQLLTLSAVSLLIVASCSKSSDSPEQEQSKNEITVNGTAYATTVIGTQTWTTVNYNGTGGVNYNDGANDPRVGRLYAYPEVKAITDLPTGWRISTEAPFDSLRSLSYTKVTPNSCVDILRSRALHSLFKDLQLHSQAVRAH